MPSPRRRPKAYTSDLSPEALDGMTWAQLTALARLGRITWTDVRDVLRRRHLERYGGIDPYAHLRPLEPWEHGGRPYRTGDEK